MCRCTGVPNNVDSASACRVLHLGNTDYTNLLIVFPLPVSVSYFKQTLNLQLALDFHGGFIVL